ncbi:hypothetical protein FACS189435_1730 [Bacteroidia bacterium]|nr:hypothetical protein FACS189435_1730 [Bacteroidia bacterium]
MIVISCFSCSFAPVYAQQTNTPPLPALKEQTGKPEVSVIAINNRIKVSNVPIGSKLEIYSVVGIKVAEIEIKQAEGEYTVNIAKGYYIVRIGETVCKIAMR